MFNKVCYQLFVSVKLGGVLYLYFYNMSNKKRIEPEEFIYIDTWVLSSAFMLVSIRYNRKIK